MASKPPPLPPDARRPKRAPHAPPRPPSASRPPSRRRSPTLNPDNPPPRPRPDRDVPAPARAGRALARASADVDVDVANRGHQPLRRRIFLLAAELLRLRPAVRARLAATWPGSTYVYFAATLPTLPDIATYRGSPRRRRCCAPLTARRSPSSPASGARSCRSTTSPAARRRLPGHRGPPLLRPRRHRLPRHRARAGRQPARRRRRAGRLDHHPAGGQVVPVLRADATAQDQGGDPRAAARGALLEARDPRALPEPDLPRPRRLRRAAAARRYFDKEVGELDLGEMALLAGLARAPSRFSPLTNRRPRARAAIRCWRTMVAAGFLTEDEAKLARAPRHGAPAPRLLPHDVAVFHRARAARRRATLRREEAARGRPRDRDHGRAVDRRRRRRRTSTSRCASWTSGRAGAARTRGSRARRPTFPRALAALYGDDPPVEGRLYLGLVEGDGGRGAARVRVGKGSTRCRPRRWWAVPYSTRDAATASCSSRRSACCARATSSG